MKPLTKWTPLTLVGLLGSGALIFGLNAFCPVPAETVLAAAGGLIFAAGLLFGVFALFRSLAALRCAEARHSTGLVVPIVTIILAAGAWFVVIATFIQVRSSFEKRTKSQNERLEATRGKEMGIAIHHPSLAGDWRTWQGILPDATMELVETNGVVNGKGMCSLLLQKPWDLKTADGRAFQVRGTVGTSNATLDFIMADGEVRTLEFRYEQDFKVGFPMDDPTNHLPDGTNVVWKTFRTDCWLMQAKRGEALGPCGMSCYMFLRPQFCSEIDAASRQSWKENGFPDQDPFPDVDGNGK
jgi:hypothetical protein